METRTQLPATLPAGPWIVLGGMGLAALAGYVNACMLALFRVPVSHTTGALTHLGIDLLGGDRHELITTAAVLVGFFVGAVISGTIVGGREIAVGRRYGVALVLEGLLLLAAGRLAASTRLEALPVAALACGLQNAMAASYRGLVVRTTHTTGLITDLGVHLGRRLRGDDLAVRPFYLLALLVVGFFAGVLAGAVMAHGGETRPDAVAWAAVPALVAGSIYWYRRHRELRLRDARD